MNVTRIGSKLLLVASEDETQKIVATFDAAYDDMSGAEPAEEVDQNRNIANPLRLALKDGPSLPIFRAFKKSMEELVLREALTSRTVTQAARALGFKHHQSTIALLDRFNHLREEFGITARKRRNPLRSKKTGQRVTPVHRSGPRMHVATSTELRESRDDGGRWERPAL